LNARIAWMLEMLELVQLLELLECDMVQFRVYGCELWIA